MSKNSDLTPTKITLLIKSQVGIRKTYKVLAAVKKRLGSMPKDKFLSDDEMIALIGEEIEKAVGDSLAN